GFEQFAVGFDNNVAVFDGVGILDVVAIEEAVVQVAQVTWLVGYSDLLGQTGAQGVGTGNDDAVIHTQLEERVTNGVDLGQEVGVRNSYLAVLVTALLL